MEESKELEKSVPYYQHPLYRKAMQQITDGDGTEAIASLERLAEAYPGEQPVQDLLLRTQLRTTFESNDYVRVDHTQPRPVVRNVMLLLLAITVCLVLVTGFTAAYNRVWLPRVRAQEEMQYVESLWGNGTQARKSGDLSRAREIFEELAAFQPEFPEAQQRLAGLDIQGELALIDQLQGWSDQLADAVLLKERGEWQSAMDLANQIPPESPDYERAQGLIQEAQELAAMEATWQDAQASFGAEDWRGVISALTWIRAQSPGFRRAELEEQLFQAYVRVSLLLITQANGNVDPVREAVGYLSQALTLRPANRELIEEKELATGFVSGADALGRGDWVGVVTHWEPVYEKRPDYQPTLKQRLDEAYPRAARQLIDQASGSERSLDQALDLIDQALTLNPEHEELLEERRRIVVYLSGLEAFQEERWDSAIALWGPLYELDPNYQDGALRDKLALACESSEEPDEAYCQP